MEKHLRGGAGEEIKRKINDKLKTGQGEEEKPFRSGNWLR